MQYLETEDIQKIETTLGISLPQHYKDFHLSNRTLLQELRDSDVNPEDDGMYISTDAENIIEYNQFSGLPKTEGPTRNKYYIGGDGCGGSYFVDLKNPDNTEVYFVSPDNFTEIFDEEADDFKWDSDLVLAGKTLEDFTKKTIAFNKSN